MVRLVARGNVHSVFFIVSYFYLLGGHFADEETIKKRPSETIKNVSVRIEETIKKRFLANAGLAAPGLALGNV